MSEKCIVWQGYCEKAGYGKITRKVDGKTRTYRAHRYVYEQSKGPIPKGMVVHHKCRRRSCVNPSHLELVTPTANAQESVIIRKAAYIRATEKERAYLIKLLQGQSSEEAATLLRKLK